MRKQAIRFLVDLSMDPLKREAFQRNPQAVLASSGLTDEEAKSVLGGNSTTEDPPPILILVMS